tara:strand:- start:745 stop:1032 length:288 start_codon:yes stop_codon:yes gene_type:complete
MKYLLIILIIIFAPFNLANTKENCEGVLSKLKSECNIIGKSMDKMKKFSKENKTIGQTLGISGDDKEKKSLKEFSKENKTIDQTYKNIKEKLKKK